MNNQDTMGLATKRMLTSGGLLREHSLAGGCKFFSGRLPASLIADDEQFARLWSLHPASFHQIKIHGRVVATPRWQQAYGADYHYTGNVNKALAVPPLLEPLLAWARANLDERLNGLLLNWYDGRLGHYIGRHRDSTKNMIPGAPIVTMSFGDERIFRLRPWPAGKPTVDFLASDGAVFLMPYETNLAWTHEVPRKRNSQRRISVTFRAFNA